MQYKGTINYNGKKEEIFGNFDNEKEFLENAIASIRIRKNWKENLTSIWIDKEDHCKNFDKIVLEHMGII